MSLRSCCLTLAGSRVCALAVLRDLSASACASPQAGHLQPLVHRARVPWPHLALSGVRVATSALAPCVPSRSKVSTCVDSTAAMVARSNNTLRPKCDHDSLAGPCNRRATGQVQRGSRRNHGSVGIRRDRVQPAQGSTAVTDPADSLLAIHTRAGRACRCRKARTSRLRTS
jgi:hypothetical protein